MIDKAIYDEYEKALGANAALVERALLMLDLELQGLTGANLQAALAASYAEIVLKYGAVAAQCAVEFYTDVRAGTNLDTEFIATQATPQSSTYLTHDAQWAMSNSASPASYTKNLAGRAIKRVYEQADNTIISNARRDPARPKWALVPSIGACGLCIMLGSLGFYYSKKSTAASARHTNCRCATVVDFDTKNPYLEGYDPDGMYDRYLECREAIEVDAEAKGRALYGKNITRSTGESHDAYDAYLRNRIVKEMNTRDREWLRTGKVTPTDYSLNAKTNYGILKKANDFSSVNITDKGNEWRDLRAHYVLEQNGIVAQAQGRKSIDLIIGGQYWEVKSPEQPKTQPKAGRELSFIESNIRSAVKQFEKRKLAEQTI